MEPQEDAVVLFMTFPVSDEIKDSVALAAKCIAALREQYPDLQATNMNSTPERERTIADLTLTAEGEKGTGHGYFFRTREHRHVSTSCWPRPHMWNELRPTLTTIAANLAYAPQGVAAVQEEGQQLAAGDTDARSMGRPLAGCDAQAGRRAARKAASASAGDTAGPVACRSRSPRAGPWRGQGVQFVAHEQPPDQDARHGLRVAHDHPDEHPGARRDQRAVSGAAAGA